MWPVLHNTIWKALFVYFVLVQYTGTLVYLIYTSDSDIYDNDNYDYLWIYRVSEVPEENVRRV